MLFLFALKGAQGPRMTSLADPNEPSSTFSRIMRAMDCSVHIPSRTISYLVWLSK